MAIDTATSLILILGLSLTSGVLAALFDAEANRVRIDMSEYQERHTVSRRIGAPPGYIGNDKGGKLTAAAFYQNPARMGRAKGKRLQRRRGEFLERTFGHLCETGAARRTRLRGRGVAPVWWRD